LPRYFIAGGAGFIGSHVARRLVQRPDAEVVVADNFTSGRAWHLDEIDPGRQLRIVRLDLKQLGPLADAIEGADLVFHFASNPDIAKAVKEPCVDFWEGTFLTQNLLEAMRQTGVRRLIYASGSGVYGDAGARPVGESFSPMQPISTYGASKLACEAMICAYCHLFEMHALAFRFANVVGPRQTHGVAYDFLRRLRRQPSRLEILGDGSQSKSYVHVDDVLDALLFLADSDWRGFDVFNVATGDYITVREIADLVVERLGLSDVRYEYTGGDRGWKGDLLVVRFDTEKLRERGWRNQRTSKQAIADAVDSLIADAKAGRLDNAS